jgi:hypothetical protein
MEELRKIDRIITPGISGSDAPKNLVVLGRPPTGQKRGLAQAAGNSTM